jgi:peptide/nickel transport system permease protein
MGGTLLSTVVDRIAGDRLRENSQLNLIIQRFVQNKLAMVGLACTSIYFLVALVGPLLITQEPTTMDPANRFAAPSLVHPFGTDRYGRDVFSRVIIGARISLYVAVAVVVFSTVLGVLFGLVAGYFRGWVDESIMRSIDILFAFPSILLALIVIAILGPGLDRAIFALAVAFTPIMVRVTRGSALSVRENEYVMAAISYGESSLNIMFRDMLPNLVSAVMVQATITFAFAILAEAGLSYLGLSAQPPSITWGLMITEGQASLEFAPWVSFFPGVAIMLTVLSLTFLGVGLRDAFDPKTDVETDVGGGI